MRSPRLKVGQSPPYWGTMAFGSPAIALGSRSAWRRGMTFYAFAVAVFGVGGCRLGYDWSDALSSGGGAGWMSSLTEGGRSGFGGDVGDSGSSNVGGSNSGGGSVTSGTGGTTGASGDMGAGASLGVGGAMGADASLGPVGLGAGTLATFGERTGTTYSGVTNDTFISGQVPTGSYWRSNGLSVTVDMVALVRFDLSALPTTATVTGGELSLEVLQNPMTNGGVTVHQVLEQWIDSQTLWNERLTGVAWTTAGCGVGSRSATVLGNFAPYAKAEYKIPLPASVLQGWVESPSANFGFALVGYGTSYVDFKGSGVGVGKQPVLSVTYSP